MNKKKPTVVSNVSEGDKKFLYTLGAILILALAFFFAFSPFNKKAEKQRAENDEMKAYVAELDSKIANEAQKKAEIITFDTDRNEIISKFPGGMTHEKAIKILADLEKETEIFSSQVALSVNNIFFNQEELRSSGTYVVENENIKSESPYAVQGIPEKTYPDIMGLKTTLTLSFACSDEELEKALDFINGYEDKMSVETITVGFDETTGELVGTMNLCMYALEGLDNAYEEPTIEGVDLGVVNVFSAKDMKPKKKKKK